MFTDQRNELLRSYEKCNRVNKPEQAKNDKACQPVGISAHEKFSKKILRIHRKDAAQRPTSGVHVEQNPDEWHLAIGTDREPTAIENPRKAKSKTILPGRRIELPTNPECFRGCSNAVNSRLRAWDSSFALMSSRFLELLQELELPSWRRFRANRPVA